MGTSSLKEIDYSVNELLRVQAYAYCCVTTLIFSVISSVNTNFDDYFKLESTFHPDTVLPKLFHIFDQSPLCAAINELA